MATGFTLEERLAKVEAAVRELRWRLEARGPSPDWLVRLIGTFKDETAFEEVLEYGRDLRQADRPPARGLRTVKFLLDTDYISILQRQARPEFVALFARTVHPLVLTGVPHLPNQFPFAAGRPLVTMRGRPTGPGECGPTRLPSPPTRGWTNHAQLRRQERRGVLRRPDAT